MLVWRGRLARPRLSLLALLACAWLAVVAARAESPETGPRYAGVAACGACHAEQAARWQRSHHAQSMQIANDRTVLGAFTDQIVRDGDVRARLFRAGPAFKVETAGRDGADAVFDIAYTFGVSPLQQYLIAFPNGRLQVFGLAWDTRPRAQGGQRWFRPQAGDAAPGSPLHWTGREMNWNFACAACHSTGLRKNYDPASNRFATTWSDIDVACEACHGPGSAHIAWANGADRSEAIAGARGFLASLDHNDVPRFAFASATRSIASPVAAAGSAKLGDVCFPCHARREQLVEAPIPGQAFLDDYRPALLEPSLYQPDGQNEGEVFEYGAFAQSRMAQAGVTCVNCHDAHGSSLKAPGNGVCAQCHRAEVFDTPAHTQHAAGSTGGQCAACHMPTRTYMGVHVRHDHGFRLPRPELADIGVTNGCTACHAGRSPAWLSQALARWHAASRPTGFADAFADARANAPADRRMTAALSDPGLPGIVRATAASLLADPAAAAGALRNAAGDTDPLVRLGAARALAHADAGTRAAIGRALLTDPRRAVRVEAAQSLAELPPGMLPASDTASLREAIKEWKGALHINQDRPEALVDLGSLLASQGDPGAGATFAAAIGLAPDSVPARLDLADLARAEGHGAASLAILTAAVKAAPQDPAPLDALALLHVRAGDRANALARLAQAVHLAPTDATSVRLDVLALSEAGRWEEADAVLGRALAAHPRDLSLLEMQLRLAPASGAADAIAAETARDTVPSR